MASALALSFCAGPAVAADAADGSTVESVRARGFLRCGVSKNAAGFSRVNKAGNLAGLAIDFCAAISAAVLGSRDKVKFIPLTDAGRFTALQSGNVDVLVHNASWTLGRDGVQGVQFVAPLFYEATALLVRMDQNVESVLELAGASICVLAGSASQQNTATFFRARNMRFEGVAFEKWSAAVEAYQAKRCQVLAGDMTRLAKTRKAMSNAEKQMLLPEYLALEPLGPVVRTVDANWFKLIRWTVAAMVRAEELGLTSANVDAMRGQTDPVVRRFLGGETFVGKTLGVNWDWTYQIVKQVGNYGESFERNFGAGSSVKIDRSINNLWSAGGLHLAPQFR